IISETLPSIQGLEEEKEKLKQEKEVLEAETRKLQEEKEKLNLEKQALQREKKEKEEKLEVLSEEQKKLLEEYEILKKDLKKFQKIAKEVEDSEFDFREIQNILRIYSVLIEEIWQSKPHFKILMLLHGDKEEMSKNDIKNSTGISGAMVLRAIHELKAANLIEYDENTGMVKLTKRFFPKMNKKEKTTKE
ncbi:MAG: hypothetical protein ACTSXF_08380, partial [Promethearchaeota archaeon]